MKRLEHKKNSRNYRSNSSKKSLKSNAIQMHRFVYACFFITILGGVIYLSGHFIGRLDAQASGAAPDSLISSNRLISFANPFQTLSNVDSFLSTDVEELDSDYVSEIGVLDGAFSIRSYCSGAVVGYSIHGSAETTVSKVEALMKERGWIGIPMRGIEGVSFSKDFGKLRWAVVTVDHSESISHVVVRCF